MDWAELKNFLVQQTNTEDFNISDTLYYDWLSRSHKKVAEMVKTRTDSKYFQSRFEVDIVRNQKRYDEFPASIFESVYIKYSTTDDFKEKATPVDMQEASRDPDYYSENQSKNDPVYEVVGDSIIVYPTPDSDVARWMLLIGKKNMWNIDASTAETAVFNGKLTTYHDIIAHYAKRYVYQHTHEYNKKAECKEEFMEMLDDMITEISDRWSQPRWIQEPDVSSLL